MRHLLFALLVIVAATSFAGRLDDYYAKQKKICDWIGVKMEFDTKSAEEYAKDYKKYLAEANSGKAEAMYRLGRLIEDGRGALTNDYKAALVWYKKALEKKHPATMNHLATMCMTSQGVETDFEKAVKLYEEAAKLGNTDAMLNLGVLHEYGLVFKQDKKEAVKWYEKAAEKGNAAAMRVLGDINHRERSDHRDDRAAVKWYSQASSKGSALATERLADIYMNSELWVTPQVKPDQRKAFELYMKALGMGRGKVLGLLMELYGKEKLDDPKLKRIAEKAAKLWAVRAFGLDGMPGDDEDFEEIGELDLDEDEDDVRLNNIYNNDIPLMDEGIYPTPEYDSDKVYCLFFEDGETKFIKERCLVPKAAVKWFEKLAEKGDADALYVLGRMYNNGEVKDYDEYGGWSSTGNEEQLNAQKALPYLEKAAEKGNVEALVEIGVIYEMNSLDPVRYNDEAVRRKKAVDAKNKAMEWYKKAADKGSKRGKDKLSLLKQTRFAWELEEEKKK